MIETDVLIVGAGPAGLATAIALLRNAGEKNTTVCSAPLTTSPKEENGEGYDY